jgi:glycosyltransferase involved in cell wall biosynthesis
VADARVAIVHDWLTGMRGGERVLEALCRLFPAAAVHTLVHVPGAVSPAIASHRIRTPPGLAWLPNRARWYRHYLPLYPAAVECFDLDDADVVISTSHCAAKSVVRTGAARHLCYCHSPMRYVWDQYDHYFGPGRLSPARSALLRPLLAWLARWDRLTAPRVDRFLANSQYVAGRIARYYNRQAAVVYPPVDTAFYTPGSRPSGSYFLVVSALVPYKRVDVAIDAANRLNVPLKIIGIGPDEARLRARAGTNVEFAGTVDAPTLREAYRGAQALVLPAEEDFGISPVEAMACGRPVIALSRGGATETVVDAVTGWLVSDQDADAFALAMARVATTRLDPGVIRARAERFGPDAFDAAVREHVAAACAPGGGRC